MEDFDWQILLELVFLLGATLWPSNPLAPVHNSFKYVSENNGSCLAEVNIYSKIFTKFIFDRDFDNPSHDFFLNLGGVLGLNQKGLSEINIMAYLVTILLRIEATLV